MRARRGCANPASPRAPGAGTGWGEVYATVRRIPPGRVATYGQVAALAGRPGAARQIGFALAALASDSGVPWHRVVNARGEISARRSGAAFERIQADLLRREGIVFDEAGRIDLARYRWDPDRPTTPP
ncbi:MAG TPA: MGMT family protein [Longimicrobiales bacterium]|nr:MGMT family protein [Longimicrobiales bacterium]